VRATASGVLFASLALAAPARAQTDYPLTADSAPRPGVPVGQVTRHTLTSAVFPGTRRDYWVYVPVQYRAEQAAAVMVFQDGGRFVAEDGRWRVPVVFDNLIHAGEMPVTIGIFADPGVVPARSDQEQPRFNRSFEYDGLGDRYARFLIAELLPAVAKEYNLTSDPNLRAIGGSSSGGICAFTAAWNRPDAFRRVLSFIGSYTGLRGGDGYATLVRKTEPKPLRVFLQDGRRDLDIYSGNWWVGNQGMASALDYAGNDVRFVTGEGGHDSLQGSAILPDALRWLWRDWTTPIRASAGKAGAERHYVTEILAPGQEWQVVGEGEGGAAAGDLAVNGEGDVFVVNGRGIDKVDQATGARQVFARDANARGLVLGPDRRLYACQPGRKRVVAFTPAGAVAVVADGIEAEHLVVGARGGIWATEPGHRRVWYVDPRGGKRVVHEGLESPGALALSPDQALLAVVDTATRWVWSFQLAPDGALLHGQRYYRLEMEDETAAAGAGGMTVDSDGFLYVATRLGVQAFDQPGRVDAILSPPSADAPSGVVFAGKDLDTLYVTAGNKLFRRRLRRKGVLPWQPVKPPTPRL
jgi:enterochelin esterase-like enzyme/sugar lactone lactonase YvrE